MTLPLISQKRIEPLTKTKLRIGEIDCLRGLIMIIMALDHTRDLFHVDAFTQDPLNLQTTTPILFFTRWITHFCAPVFVFLSGTSVYLQSLRKSKSELSGLLIKRGIWLIVVELLIMSLGITFDPHYSAFILQVIWSIGISMVILGIAIWLPFEAILAIGAIIVLAHNALDFTETGKTNFSIWYSLIHRQGFYPLWDHHSLAILYPFLPWTGVMFLGYCFGRIYKLNIPEAVRNKRIAMIGGGLLLLFVILRAINVYGDPLHWTQQKTPFYTFLSFINTQKYPPSLLYLSLFLGIALIGLSFMNKLKSGIAKILSIYGRVPFFYYVIHFYSLHLLSAIFFLLRGHSMEEGLKGAANLPFKFIIPGEGYSLAIVYLIWISLVIVLYPLCKWFGEYKRSRNYWWLHYC
jgi:uncharacterized membrane protein